MQGQIFILVLLCGLIHASWSPSQRISSIPNVSHTIGQGVAVSADGSVVVVTHQGSDPSNPAGEGGGVASVFRKSGSSEWTLEKQLWPSNAVPVFQFGSLDPLVATSVAITPAGTRILVGIPGNDEFKGASWIFDFDTETETWSETHQFIGSSSTTASRQAEVVALSDDGLRVVNCAPSAGNTRGVAWVWRFVNDVWIEDPALINPEDALFPSAFGRSVAFFGATGSVLVIGAPQADAVTELEPIPSYDGQVYLFSFNGTQWIQGSISPLLPSNAEGSQFGTSIALSTNGKVFVGGPFAFSGQGAFWTFDLSTGEEIAAPATHEGSFNANILLGYSLAVDGDATKVLAGAPNEIIDMGGFHTFTWDVTEWSQTFYNAETTNVYQPYEGKALAVSRDGSTVVMGAYENQFYTGSVWIYQ